MGFFNSRFSRVKNVGNNIICQRVNDAMTVEIGKVRPDPADLIDQLAPDQQVAALVRRQDTGSEPVVEVVR